MRVILEMGERAAAVRLLSSSRARRWRAGAQWWRGPAVAAQPLSSSREASEITKAFFGKGPRWSLQSLVEGVETMDGARRHKVEVDLDRLADLAHLKIDDASRPSLERDLHEILNMAALVQEATADEGRDASHGEASQPSSQGDPQAPTTLRKDKVSSADVSEKLLANAKKTESGYFVVPNVS